jgi:hypothetical protein
MPSLRVDLIDAVWVLTEFVVSINLNDGEKRTTYPDQQK